MDYTVTALCSEGPMFRRSYAQKVLCSEGPLFRRFYVQKDLCSEGSIFRRFYVQKVLCSEIFVQKVLCLENMLAIKQYYLFNLSESVYIYNKKYVFLIEEMVTVTSEIHMWCRSTFQSNKHVERVLCKGEK